MAAQSLTEKLAALGIVSGTAAQGAAVKTLFLKDKRSHAFAVVALESANVDLKVLSTRLGLGKGGLQELPEAALAYMLQSPSVVSFLGLEEPAAKDVVALVDHNLSGDSAVQVLAADGSGPISMCGNDVQKFLRSICSSVSSVDFSLSPKIDRDNPPDLKQLADSAAVLEPLKSAAAAPATAAVAAQTPKQTAKSASAAKTNAKDARKPAAASSALNVDAMVSRVVEKCFSVASQDGAQASMDSDSEATRVLLADLRMELTSLKNAAYANGLAAARGALRMQLEA